MIMTICMDPGVQWFESGMCAGSNVVPAVF